MRIELEFYLEQLLRQEAGASFLLGEALSPEARNLLYEVRGEVTRCPFPEDGVLSSNITFHAMKGLRRVRENEGLPPPVFGPVELARVIADASERAEKRWFFLRMSEHGHLNAAPLAEFCTEFVTRARKHPALLFQQEPFVLLPAAVPPSPGVVTVRVTDHFLDEARRRNEDAGHLLDARKKEGLSADDLLMLYALSFDSELEAGPYLRGLFGRHNVPWLVRRFLQASGEMLKTSPEPSGWKGAAEPFGRSLLDDLLEFRWEYLHVASGRQPARFFAFLRRIASSFFSDYQQPGCRAALAQGATPLFYAAAAIARDAVYLSVENLVFCCDSSGVKLEENSWQPTR